MRIARARSSDVGSGCHNAAARAAIALVMTPAPDLTALLTKIDAIREHEFDNCNWMQRKVSDVVQEDAERVTAWHMEAGA